MKEWGKVGWMRAKRGSFILIAVFSLHLSQLAQAGDPIRHEIVSVSDRMLDQVFSPNRRAGIKLTTRIRR